MKRLVLVLFAFHIMVIGFTQNLVGYHLDDIKKIMKTTRLGYNADETSLKSKTPSIKYIDTEGDNTLIFFLDEDKKCKFSKFMLDISLAKHTVDTLTKRYKYLDNLTWLDETGDTDCVIQMVNSEWFMTVIIKPKE